MLQLSIDVERTGRDVVARCACRNTGAMPILVAWVQSDGRFSTIPERAAVMFEARRRTLVLSLTTPAVPPGVLVNVRAVPWSRRLDPGASLVATYVLAEPVHEWHPYALPEPADATVPDRAERIEFRTQSILESAARKITPHPTDPLLLRVSLGGEKLASAQKALAPHIAVARRVDPEFYRY